METIQDVENYVSKIRLTPTDQILGGHFILVLGVNQLLVLGAN